MGTETKGGSLPRFRDITKKFETTIDKAIPKPVTFLTLFDNAF